MAYASILDLESCRVELADSILHLIASGRRCYVVWLEDKSCSRQSLHVIGFLELQPSPDRDGRTTVTIHFDPVTFTSEETRKEWTKEIGLAVFKLLVSEFERHGFDTLGISISLKECRHLVWSAKKAGFLFRSHENRDSITYWIGQRQLKSRQQRRHERKTIGQFELRRSRSEIAVVVDWPDDGRLRHDIHRVIADASGQVKIERVVFWVTAGNDEVVSRRLCYHLGQMFGIVIDPNQELPEGVTITREVWERYMLRRKHPNPA